MYPKNKLQIKACSCYNIIIKDIMFGRKDCMKKYLKVTAMLLSGIMLAVTAGGCGQKNADNADIKTITIWSGNAHSKQFYERVVNEYNNGEGKKKGIKIDYQVKAGDSLKQTLSLALENGTAPDMFNSGDFKAMAENDQIISIDDLPGGKEYMDKYRDELVIDLNLYNDKAYSIPQNSTTHGLVYNVDMFKKAGIVDENGNAKPPETIAEMIEDAKKLTNTSNGEYGMVLPMKFGAFFQNYIGNFMQPNYGYAQYNPKDGSYHYENYVPFMQMYLDMKNDGSIFPGTETVDNDTARAQFAAGKIGMIIGFSYDYGVLTEQYPAKCEWDVATLPLIDKNEKYNQTMFNSQVGFYINKQSVDKIGGDKLMEVYKFFTSDDIIVQMYKEGLGIPTNTELIDKTELDDSMKQWQKFAELVKISTPMYTPILNPASGQKSLQNKFIEDVWTAKMSPQDAVKGMNEDAEKRMKEYYAQHPEKDYTVFIKPEWDIKR